MKLPSLFLLLCILLTSCTEKGSQLETDLNAQYWNLTKLTVDGNEVNLSASPLEDRSLQFYGGRAAGSVGLNSFQVTFKMKDPDSLAISPDRGGMTEMAGPQPIMDLENICMAALQKVTTAKISGETLTLSGGGVEMTYQGKLAEPQAPGNPEDSVTTDSSGE